MKFAVKLPGLTLSGLPPGHWAEAVTAEDFVEMARRTDELGFDQLHFSEHIAMHPDFVGELGDRWSHCVTAMAFAAAATKQIRLRGLVVVPYHQPVELAKALATLDYMSGGRLILLAAVGYMEWEYELLGVPYSERGAVMDEYLDAIIELWTSDEPRFEGRYVRFENIRFEPKPAQKPRPTIYMAGRAKAALRRLVRIGADGWMTYDTKRGQLPGMLDHLREQPGFRENPRQLDLELPLFEGRHHPVTHKLLERAKIVLEREAILEQVGELAELGVTIIRADGVFGTKVGADLPTRNGQPVPPPRSVAEYLEQLQWFAEEVLPAARSITARDVWTAAAV